MYISFFQSINPYMTKHVAPNRISRGDSEHDESLQTSNPADEPFSWIKNWHGNIRPNSAVRSSNDPLAMDQQPPFDPPSYQLPQSLPDSGLLGIRENNNASDSWLSDEVLSEWNMLNDFYFCSSAPASSEWPTWMNQEIPTPDREAVPIFPSEDLPGESLSSMQPTDDASAHSIPLQSLGNVSQWLEGAFRPPVPCSYCRKHRLQCLTIRTTAANPNPVTSCSSCVALFRECSLSRGEKRLASGFETFTPVLGHLHGLPEHTQATVSHKQARCPDI